MDPNLMLLLQYQAVIVEGLTTVGGLIAAALAGDPVTDEQLRTASNISQQIVARGDAILAQDQTNANKAGGDATDKA